MRAALLLHVSLDGTIGWSLYASSVHVVTMVWLQVTDSQLTDNDRLRLWSDRLLRWFHLTDFCYLWPTRNRHASKEIRLVSVKWDEKAVLSQRWHGCPEKFRDSLTTPTAIIPNIFHGLLFQSTLWMFLQNLKSVALPVSEIIGGTEKIWAVPVYAHAPFSTKFLTGFYSDWPCKYTRQIWSS